MALTWIRFATLFSIAGIALILSAGGEYIYDVGGRIVYVIRKRFKPVAMRWIEENNEEYDVRTVMTSKVIWASLSSNMFFWVILAAALSLLCFDLLLSTAVMGITITFGYLFISRRNTTLLRKLNKDTENMLINFMSRYPVNRSIYETLEDVSEDLPEGQLQNALSKVCNGLRMNTDIKIAVQPLAELNNSSLRQFSVIISEISDPDTFIEILSDLLKDVNSRANLIGEIRRTLTVIRVTVKILQTICVVAYLICSLLPAWRSYFLTDHHFILFLVMAIFSTMGSFIVEMEIKKLEEA